MSFSEDSMIFLGCSYTFGLGLESQSECYSTIMSKHLNKKEFNFAYSGASNYSSFEKFSQLQFVENSSLILQITQLGRIKYYDYEEQCIKDRVFSNQPDRCLMSVYSDDFLLYELNRYLNLVTKYTRSNKIKLVIWDIAYTFDGKLNQMLASCFSQFKEYVRLDSSLNVPNTCRVDNGTDGLGQKVGVGHPGPQSHQLIAEKLINHYKQLYQ